MSKQLHKNFVDEQVKLLLKSYVDKEIKINYILSILRIKRRRFFELLARYKKDPDNFSIQYNRKTINRKIDKAIETNIIKELNTEKDLIKAKEVPIRCYNYSYTKDILENDYNQKVSLSTIINRAKTNGFYLTKPKRKVHEKEVITNYPGELIQHDSSHHQFSKYANKWYLITSHYSRLIPLYACEVETSYALALFPEMNQMENTVDTKSTSFIKGDHIDKVGDIYQKPILGHGQVGFGPLELIGNPEGCVGSPTLADPKKAKKGLEVLLDYLVKLHDDILEAFPLGKLPEAKLVTERSEDEINKLLKGPLNGGISIYSIGWPP